MIDMICKGKEPVKEVKTKLVPYKHSVCQTCKSHSNKPSYCTIHQDHVGRKQLCSDYSSNGLFLYKTVTV